MAYPTYWIRPPQSLSTEPGHHRFVWDLRHEPPRGARRQYSIAAVHKNTPSGPKGPFVHPGSYTIRLTVDGTVAERTLEVRLDPRVEISAEDLQLQTDTSMACYRSYLQAQELRETDRRSPINDVGRQRGNRLHFAESDAPGDPDILYGSIYETSAGEETVVGLQHKLLFLLNVLQGADARPTPQALEAVKKLQDTLGALEKRWEALR